MHHDALENRISSNDIRDKAVPGLLSSQIIASMRTHDMSEQGHGQGQVMLRHLHGIIAERNLNPLFQPIIGMSTATIVGYEGLIRGPSDSPLHSPLSLFKVAMEHGLTVEVEHLCRHVILTAFAKHGLGAKLFLNVSPECLLQANMRNGETLRYIQELRLDPKNVIIELTENAPAYDYELLREATRHYRDMGFEIAMDDLGEGFSSLRLWSELRPDYVKIDQHFIQGIDHDPVKRQFVRSIQQIAKNSGTKVVAEGIETQAELAVIMDIGIAYGQGYHLGRPKPYLATELPREVMQLIAIKGFDIHPPAGKGLHKPVSVAKLLQRVIPVSSEATNDEVFQLFEQNQQRYSIPVVDGNRPVGMVNRYTMIDRFARPFRREPYGRRSCNIFMDVEPLVVDKEMSLHELTDIIISMEPHHLSNGFIITDQGMYAGMGSGHALLREITQMQLDIARYANPLTLLPGNAPINDQIEQLLESGVTFHACYCDLDNFKPFNDVYGFRKGDEVIQLTGMLLRAAATTEHDFLGHIGGDDFILLLRCEDWEARCQSVLQQFAELIPYLYSEQDQASGGIETEDRKGDKVFYPMLSLSIGVVCAEPGMFAAHLEVAAAASIAKCQAKKITGNSLFLERRGLSGDS